MARSRLSWLLTASLAPTGFAAAQPPPDPTVSELVVTAPDEAPIPKVGPGAPVIAPAELEAAATEARLEASEASSNARRCSRFAITSDIGQANTIRDLMAASYRNEQQTERALSVAAAAAQAASEAARADRRAAAKGERTEEAVFLSELQRQLAVYKFLNARREAEAAKARTATTQRLIREVASRYVQPSLVEQLIVKEVANRVFISEPLRKAADGSTIPFAQTYADLALEDVAVRERLDDKGLYLHVSGKIRNPRQRGVATPALSVSAVDEFGFAVKTEIADGRGQIGAGAAVPFVYELRPKPSRAVKVVVTFASRDRALMSLPPGAPLINEAPAAGEGSMDCSTPDARR